MMVKKIQHNPKNAKVAFRLDTKTVEIIDTLEIPVASLGAKVRYLMMRGIENVQARKPVEP